MQKLLKTLKVQVTADVGDKATESTAADDFVSELEARNCELKREIAEMELIEENKKLMEKLDRYKNGQCAPISGCSGGRPRCELGLNGAQEILSLDALRDV